MNNQIADAIMEHLSPKGVAVVVEGEHTCMTARDVKRFEAKQSHMQLVAKCQSIFSINSFQNKQTDYEIYCKRQSI
jgi:GTP cyclohydrolase I